VEPHCFDADLDPDPAQNLDKNSDLGGGGRSVKNVHPPWQNLRYAHGFGQQNVSHIDLGGDFLEAILSLRHPDLTVHLTLLTLRPKQHTAKTIYSSVSDPYSF
jgi:hypothetical protein